MRIDAAGTGGKGCGDMNGGNMTGRKGREGKKLAREILEYLGVSLLLSAFIFCFLFFTSDSVAEIYLMNRGDGADSGAGRSFDGLGCAASAWLLPRPFLWCFFFPC